MKYMPTALQVSRYSRQILAGSTALAVVLSIVLSTVNSAAVYAQSVEELNTEVTTVEVVENEAPVAEEVTEPEEQTIEEEVAATEVIETPVEVNEQETVVCEDNANVSAQSVDECEEYEPTTLRDVINENPNTSTLATLLDVLAEQENCEVVYLLDVLKVEDGLTVFAPSNAALSTLVRAPGNNADEVGQLLTFTDELCELISYHIHGNEILAADVPASAVIDTFSMDDMLQVKSNASGVFVDQAKVVEADQTADNGVMHVINDVLLPQEIGTIDNIVTDSSSPELTGSTGAMALAIDAPLYEVCVVVRVDGTPYIADVNGQNWSIEEGIVTLDPLKSSTLFDVVVRACGEVDDKLINAQADTSQQLPDGRLLGLTMVRGILSYDEPDPEPQDNGQVLGDTTDVEYHPVTVTVAGSACGKGACFGVGGSGEALDNESDPSKIDSDGDGVVDSEDPEPNNPDVTGLESDESSEDEEGSEDDSSDAFWWFIGGGGIAIIWYLLWQRGGKESL